MTGYDDATMCGRASLSTPVADLVRTFELERVPLEPLVPRYNIAPSQPLAVIRRPHVLEHLTWGFVSESTGGHVGRVGAPKINVRIETAGRAPAYRESFRERRCLIVVDGFYEWKPTRDGGRAKQPYFLHREDGAPFALAGIWNDGTCAILTGRAHGIVAELHSREPIIVPRVAYDDWLNPEVRLDAAHSSGREPLVAYPVSSLVNSPANDAPECIEQNYSPIGETLSLFR